MIQLGLSILGGKQNGEFEVWAGGVMLEILIELVVCFGLAVTYGF